MFKIFFFSQRIFSRSSCLQIRTPEILIRIQVLCYLTLLSTYIFLPIMDLQSHQSNVPLSSKIEQLRAWLTTTNQFFESINLKKEQRRLSYADYQQFRKELETQENLYSHLKTQHEEGKHDTLWKDIDTNW